MKTKLISLILAAMLTLSCTMTACTETEELDGSDPAANSESVTESESESAAESESEAEETYEVKRDPETGYAFIAHRGFSGRYQENTEEAFTMAVEAGFAGIETDVRVTSDGVYVVNHDSEVHLADGSDLSVADHTFAELTAQPLKNKHTDTELYLCTFERYLEICRDGGIIAVLELKGAFNDEQITEIFEMCEEVYTLKMCQLQSFDFNNLVKAHEQFPELAIFYTCDERDENVEKCLEYGFNIAMDYSGIDKETIDDFHERGLEVDVWTVNSAKGVTRFWGKGFNVDYMESDFAIFE